MLTINNNLSRFHLYVYSPMRFTPSQLTTAILAVLSTSTYAASENTALEKQVALLPIVVEAQETLEVGKTVYTKEDLDNIPNGSKSLVNLLRVNPNIQFSNEHAAASSQADLKSNEISIHGAQSFQNKFVINGVSNTNILDPLGMGTGNYGGISAGSQGIEINTDLLCNVEVLDSNVSAQHGGFSGGVISADTCAPTTAMGKIHGQITYDYTSSDWLQYHLKTDADKGLFEGESTQGNQKEFTKQGLSANLYSKLSDVYGINFYASQRRAEIPVASGLDAPKEINQRKQNTNAGLTLFANPNANHAMKFGLTVGDLEDNTYADKRLNSHNTVKNESVLLFAESKQQHNWGNITHKLNYQQIDNSRFSDSDRGINWLHAVGSKDWNDTSSVWEGASSASIELAQSSLKYSADSLFNPFYFLDTKHQMSAGLGYQRDEVKWERLKDFATHYGVTSGNSKNLYDLEGQSCQINDPLCDENPTSSLSKLNYQGQYFRKGNLYKAGQFAGDYAQISAYIEDEMQWENVKLRLGVRADYDESNNNLNIAPRSSLTLQPFGQPNFKITTGWNRYYSAPTYITDLQSALTELDYSIQRTDPLAAWTETRSHSANATRRNDLKTPYADELVLGLNGQYKNSQFALKWVNRQYEDEISRNRSDVSAGGAFIYSYEYGNSGYGENDTVTLEVSNIQPLALKNTKHKLSLAVNYSDSYRGTPDYTTNLKEEDVLKLVSYNGEIMRSGDRPASNYNQPVTARVLWDISFDHLPLRINNFFQYKDTYQQVLSSANKVVYEGQKLDTYTLTDVKPRFSWDIQTNYDLKLSKDYDVILGLTVNNVTDRNNLYVSGTKLYSEIGRQFIADITFKF
jgi:hypothetical protein